MHFLLGACLCVELPDFVILMLIFFKTPRVGHRVSQECVQPSRTGGTIRQGNICNDM